MIIRSCARAWPIGYMSRGVHYRCTGHAAADFCAAVILCSQSQWCSKFVLGQTSHVRAVVEEAMAAMNTGPSEKVLSISLADQHWLTNLPGKIFSACMKFGGSRRRDAETHGGQTDRHTDTNAKGKVNSCHFCGHAAWLQEPGFLCATQDLWARADKSS